MIHNTFHSLLEEMTAYVCNCNEQANPSEPAAIYGLNLWIARLQTYLPQRDLDDKEAFLLAITLVPHLDPAFLDRLFEKSLGEGNFPQLGGMRGIQHRGILPTGELVLYILAGDDVDKRAAIRDKYLSGEHWLFRENILYLEPSPSGEPSMSGKLIQADEYVELFLTGKKGKPKFGIDFPANCINTRQEWSDLVLHPHTQNQVQNLQNWLEYGDKILKDWGLEKKFKLGYRALFYGPSGTGKTLTVSLLGKSTNRDVYRVDLSMVVSKYIGETNNNLSKLFDKAENKNWILFFDEADALFGKRTGVSDAHDRYANQEISYLLQRVENYNGLVILASNLKDNIDEAFLRRFQAIIHFPLPRPGERLRLWKKAIPPAVTLDKSVNFKALADQFELTGSDIINIVHFCCLEAISEQRTVLKNDHLLQGIYRELKKLGKEGE